MIIQYIMTEYVLDKYKRNDYRFMNEVCTVVA